MRVPIRIATAGIAAGLALVAGIVIGVAQTAGAPMTRSHVTTAPRGNALPQPSIPPTEVSQSTNSPDDFGWQGDHPASLAPRN